MGLLAGFVAVVDAGAAEAGAAVPVVVAGSGSEIGVTGLVGFGKGLERVVET